MRRWELALSVLSPMRATEKSRAIAQQLHALDKFEAFIVLRCQYGYTWICVNSRECSKKATLTSNKRQVSQANVWEEKTSVLFFPASLVQPMAIPSLQWSEWRCFRPAHNVYLPSSGGRFLSKIQIQHFNCISFTNTILTVTGVITLTNTKRHNLTSPLGLTTSKLLPTAL